MSVTASKRTYNGSYTGEHLNHVAFPLGGIGAGMFCLEGTGALSHVSLRGRAEGALVGVSTVRLEVRRARDDRGGEGRAGGAGPRVAPGRARRTQPSATGRPDDPTTAAP